MNTNISFKDFLTPTWFLIIIGLALGGGVGLYEMAIGHVLASTQAVPLSMSLIVYISLALVSTGISLIFAYGVLTGKQSILGNARYLLIIDIAVLMGGFVALATKLGSIPNMIYVFLSPNPASPIWWISIFYTIKLMVVFFKLVRDLMGRHSSIDRPLAVITLIVASAAAMAIGAFFGMVSARPDLRGAFAPVLLLLLAPTAGAGLLVLMNRGQELVTSLLPVLRQLALLVVVLLCLQWVFEIGSTAEGLLGWVNPLMVVLFVLAAATGGMAPRVAGGLALLGTYWVCYSYIITGQLAVLGAQQVWYGEVTLFTPNIAELLIIVLGLAVAAAIYQLGRIFLLNPDAPESQPARQATATPA